MNKKNKDAIIFVAGDLHCGHLMGLTPPKYQNQGFEAHNLVNDFWKWFEKESKKYKYTHAFWGGDLIDGEGYKDSSHHLTTNIDLQTEMASHIVNLIKSPKNYFIAGSPYHTGNRFDFEKLISDKFDEDLLVEQKLKINGIRFKLKHHVNKTSTPTGGDVILKNDMSFALIHDLLYNKDHEHFDYSLYWHAHEHRITTMSVMTGIICPALQLGVNKYYRYARSTRGYYDAGFIVIKIQNGIVTIEPHLYTKYKCAHYKEV